MYPQGAFRTGPMESDHEIMDTEPPVREGKRGSVPSLQAAVMVFLLCAGLYIVGGIPLNLALGEPGLLLSQLLFMAAPPLAYVVLKGHDLRRTFQLRLPRGGQVAAGLILLVGATQLAWFLAWLQSLVMPMPEEFLESMAEFLTADSAPRFFWLLLMVAVVPAVAEEILFRGILLSGFRTRMPALAAVILTGLIFGLVHIAPETGFRIAPTAFLGMVLAWVVVVSGSLPLASFLHFLNNGAILTLVAAPASREVVMGSPDAMPPLILLPVALVAFATGVVMLRGYRAASDAHAEVRP